MRGRGLHLAGLAVACLLLVLSPMDVYAFSNGQSASIVLGQASFTTKSVAASQTGMNSPGDIAVDSHGNVWVADFGNNRVLEFSPPWKNGEKAAVVLGQTDFTSNAPATTQTGMRHPNGVAFDSLGDLVVADSGNNRVLVFFKGTGFTNGEAATHVIGQPDFTHSAAATTQTGLSNPGSVAFDSTGHIWVADGGNNRVVQFAFPFSDGEAALLVLGQPGFTTSTAATSKTGMNFPYGVVFGPAGSAWVADAHNNRVLKFGTPFSNGEAASIVLGQPGFTSSAAATTKTGMNLPLGVGVDSLGNVWVVDSNNNRVLEFINPSASGKNGQAASIVLGQKSFTSNSVATTKNGLSGPLGVFVGVVGNIWVSDTNNNRVLQFRTTTTSSVKCSPFMIIAGQQTTCTVTVSNTSGSAAAAPGGKVTFTSTVPGSFSSTSCPLVAISSSSAQCQVDFTPSGTGTDTMTATYGGDGSHLGSKGTTTVTVT